MEPTQAVSKTSATRQRTPWSTLLYASAAALVVIVGQGCAALRNPMTPGLPWLPGKDGKFSKVVKVTPVWSDAVMHRNGEKPLRGFGGRIFFYPSMRPDAKAVKARGQIEVYAFEETDPKAANAKPDRKFVYPASQLDQWHKKDVMGHSYNLFVPYDEVGGERKKISLIVRFVPTQGGILLSEQSTVMLPGAEPTGAAEGNDPNLLQATHAASAMELAPTAPGVDGNLQLASYADPQAISGDSGARHSGAMTEHGKAQATMNTVTIPYRKTRAPLTLNEPRSDVHGTNARDAHGKAQGVNNLDLGANANSSKVLLDDRQQALLQAFENNLRAAEGAGVNEAVRSSEGSRGGESRDVKRPSAPASGAPRQTFFAGPSSQARRFFGQADQGSCALAGRKNISGQSPVDRARSTAAEANVNTTAGMVIAPDEFAAPATNQQALAQANQLRVQDLKNPPSR